jgi:hypothetical protein
LFVCKRKLEFLENSSTYHLPRGVGGWVRLLRALASTVIRGIGSRGTRGSPDDTNTAAAPSADR